MQSSVGTAYCLLLALFLEPMMMSDAKAQSQPTANASEHSALVQGSIMQKELIDYKDKEIHELQKEVERLRALITNNPEMLSNPVTSLQHSDSTEAGRGVNQATRVEKPLSSALTRSQKPIMNEAYLRVQLNSQWIVEFNDKGPRHYEDLIAARAVDRPLPSADNCSEFASAFNEDSSLSGKLSVLGFSTNKFWVVGDSAKLGICKVNKLTGNRDRARVSTLSPSRTEKAILARKK